MMTLYARINLFFAWGIWSSRNRHQNHWFCSSRCHYFFRARLFGYLWTWSVFINLGFYCWAPPLNWFWQWILPSFYQVNFEEIWSNYEFSFRYPSTWVCSPLFSWSEVASHPQMILFLAAIVLTLPLSFGCALFLHAAKLLLMIFAAIVKFWHPQDCSPSFRIMTAWIRGKLCGFSIIPFRPLLSWSHYLPSIGFYPARGSSHQYWSAKAD